VTYPDKKNMENGRVVMGDLPKNGKRKSGRVLMGDLPRKNVGEGSKAYSKGSRVRKRTTQDMVAQRRTQKEVGLENALPKKWWLKGALGRR
jgi:hypothetical protein